MTSERKDEAADQDAAKAQQPPMSRRGLLAGAGIGLGALSLASPVLGQAARRRPRRGGRDAIHAQNKRAVSAFLQEMASGNAGPVLAKYCHPDCRFEVFHPFNTLQGIDQAEKQFWTPLKQAFPNYENRIAFTIGGEYEAHDQVSTWGLVMGTFDEPWLGIPPTRGLAFLRFGFTAIVRAGRIAKAYILLDIIDVMRQAGYYPFREMPGTSEAWAFPPQDTGASGQTYDPARGARSLAIVRDMQANLPKTDEIKASNVRYSPRWHEAMNWYGPAGIGSMRAIRGFRDFHSTLFLQAFPDRGGWRREGQMPQDGPGHYMRLGDGLYACTGGYPSLHGTHLGGEWLGLPPTGRKVEMRVADWYRLDENDKIVDNWVMMDIPHILHQMGLDLFHDLTFRVNRSLPRMPLPQGTTG